MNTDAVLAAALAAITPDFSNKNADNLAALAVLLDAAQVLAQAVNDNALDDRLPTDSKLATQLQIQSWRIARLIVESSQVLESMPRI
jgi:hypothetical protein